MTEAERLANLDAAFAVEWARYCAIVLRDEPYGIALTDQTKHACAMMFAAGAKWAVEQYQAAMGKT